MFVNAKHVLFNVTLNPLCGLSYVEEGAAAQHSSSHSYYDYTFVIVVPQR